MHISLKNKTALVGGSTGGIGKGIALQLAASGASVTLMARDQNKLQTVLAQLPREKGQEHGYLVVDFDDHADFKRRIAHFFETHRVSILVNNTQGPAAGNTLEKGTQHYQEAFDLLFKNVVLTTELALQQMQKDRWGRIINVASVSVKEPLSYLALSNTIRAAVVTWAKSLATDVGPYGITVNSILTGYFDTDRIAQLNAAKAKQMKVPEEAVQREMEAKVPLGRMGQPGEYGYLAAFLASDQAAYLTGTQIPLDGGLLRSL
ncbi:SDR family oxidoreductase [Maribacter sp. 2307ULW6-5]|uniref:SDR family oxidoreductase n=1 Tax=Maribacter sp. 2307ULW6-5 TaxID=3386275 RepID=UPI0039BC86B6